MFDSIFNRAPRSIDRRNLGHASNSTTTNLGNGAFGSCEKMMYRDIVVAVRMYHNHVKESSVAWEAGVINQFDHPGNICVIWY